MNSKHFVYFALAIFGLACNDNESPCEDGTIYTMFFHDLNSDTPVVGAEVWLMKDSGTGYSVLQQLTTDENGQVSWECDLGAENIDACKDGYYDECGSGTPISSGNLADYFYEMQPRAWLKVYVNDLEPYEPEIHVRVYSTRGNTSGAIEVTSHGYYSLIPVTGNSTEPLIVRKYLNTAEAPISREDIQWVVPAGDTSVFTYNY